MWLATGSCTSMYAGLLPYWITVLCVCLAYGDKATLWAESTEHSNTMEGNPSYSLLVSTQIETCLDLDPSGCMRIGLGNKLAWTYLAGMPEFLNW